MYNVHVQSVTINKLTKNKLKKQMNTTIESTVAVSSGNIKMSKVPNLHLGSFRQAWSAFCLPFRSAPLPLSGTAP